MQFCECCGQRLDQRTEGHNRLVRLRLERGLTLDKAASMAGISPSHLSRAERGKTSPSFVVAAALAKAYACDVQELMADFVEHPLPPRGRRAA